MVAGRVLGAVAKAGTDVSALVCRSLRAVGGNDEGVSIEWGNHAALADRSFWLACG